MAFVIADRVQETTTTQGTGTVVLAGAVTGYQTFVVIGDTNTTYYTIADQAGANWEVGVGTYYLANTSLARTTILASSNSNAAVNFGLGTKSVFVTYPAERAIYADSSNLTTITNFASANVAITGGTISGVTYAGLGTMSLQNANAVAITGGTISGTGITSSNVTITGGTINNVALSNVTYGGLGTMSTQNANNISVTGGTIATTNVSTSNLIATGGTINNVIIGGTTASNGSFTNVTISYQLIANASSGANGQVLTSGGANVSPFWANASSGGGGSTGIGNSSILALNVNITSNATVNAGVNGFSVGPVNTANGVVVTITSGQRWVII
jgi:hypothetical protein